MEIVFDNTIIIPLQPDAATGLPARLLFAGLTALPHTITVKWSYQIQLLSGQWQHQQDFLQKADADTRILPDTGEMISMQELQARLILEPAVYDEQGNLITPPVVANIAHQSEANFWWQQAAIMMQSIQQAGHQFATRRGWIPPPHTPLSQNPLLLGEGRVG